MIYIGKTILVAALVVAALSLAALAGVTPVEAQPTATPTVTATATPPPPTPTATPVPPTATPTATVPPPTPTATATAATDPHISFYPALLSFTVKLGSAQSPEKALYIQNKGSGNLKWSVSATFPWLGLYPKNGDTPAGDVDTVAVWVDPEGLSQGTHTVQIMVYSDDADNSPQWVYVSVEVGEEEVVPTATPTVTVTPTASRGPQPDFTSTATPTPTPEAGGGGLPMWVWPVVGVLAVLVLALGVLLLHPAKLWGRLRGLFSRGGETAEGLTTEETYEDIYGDEGGEPPEDDV